MSSVFVVQGEHPHDPYYPLEIFASEQSALARCVELTREFIDSVWEVEEPDEPKPEVTIENWPDVEAGHSDGGDMDGFGRWWVAMREYDVKP